MENVQDGLDSALKVSQTHDRFIIAHAGDFFPFQRGEGGREVGSEMYTAHAFQILITRCFKPIFVY